VVSGCGWLGACFGGWRFLCWSFVVLELSGIGVFGVWFGVFEVALLLVGVLVFWVCWWCVGGVCFGEWCFVSGLLVAVVFWVWGFLVGLFGGVLGY